MSGLVLDASGRALVFDRVTGESRAYSVPTALENIRNGRGRFVHGETGEPLVEAVAEPEPDVTIELSEEGVLELPAAEIEAQAEAQEAALTDDPYPDLSPAQEAALDRDGDGVPGGAVTKTAKPKPAAKGGFAARK